MGVKVRVCSLKDLESKGRVLLRYGGHVIAVFYHEGKVYAIDNRCPHMGFPLIRGSVAEGILTCDWHHARFDLESGCSLDLWADDARVHRVEVVNGEVVVYLEDREWSYGDQLKRLRRGLDNNIPLLIAKALTSVIYGGHELSGVLGLAADWIGSRDAPWGGGATYIAAVNNIRALLSREDLLMGLLRGLSLASEEAGSRPPRPLIEPLATTRVPLERLRSWLRHLVEVRDREAVERVLLTMAGSGAGLGSVFEALFSAATDHYLSDGHVVDFLNKAYEYMDQLGGIHEGLLRSLAPLLVNATRYEEEQEWRRPVDLVKIIEGELSRLPGIFRERGEEANAWEVAHRILGENPHSIASYITGALERGVDPSSISLGVALAAASRIAHFSSSNELGDWITVLHTFSYANAIHQAFKRARTWEVFRGVYHGALRVYLDRFLNVPPFKVPKGSHGESKERILQALLQALDRRYMVDEAAGLVADYLANGYETRDLVKTLCHAALREDADFHTIQMLEAGVKILEDLGGSLGGFEQEKIVLVAMARYIASQSPTQRRLRQTAGIALKLYRGEELFREGRNILND